jgi:hypothetical protein
MTDDDLRALVRAAIAQHTGQTMPVVSAPAATALRLHPSHGRFALLSAGSDAEGLCLIEPAVPCNHCGYCQSYGH